MHQDVGPRNITRTWTVDLYGSWGDGASAKVYISTRTVTLTADAQGQRTATIDGQDAAYQDAVFLLDLGKAEGRVQLVHEERLPDPASLPIGKPRASLLHRIMGKVGVPHPEHYALSAAALGQSQPLTTLASLTEDEARKVWTYLCSLYPRARQVAQNLSARVPVAA